MSQTPITVTYSLEEILGEINQNIKEVNQKLENLQKDVTDIKIGQIKLEGEIKALDEKLTGKINTLNERVTGIDKRLENQEFVNRGILIALIVTILGGFAKLFGLIGNP